MVVQSSSQVFKLPDLGIFPVLHLQTMREAMYCTFLPVSLQNINDIELMLKWQPLGILVCLTSRGIMTFCQSRLQGIFRKLDELMLVRSLEVRTFSLCCFVP